MSPTYSVCPEHGYLAGEHFNCPHCGKPAEVYSRITGYYRPVQNWNDGKSQEYKERKVYSILDRQQRKQAESQPMLFTTATCPNCSIARAALEAAGMAYRETPAEENKELARRYQVRQAPTLVIDRGGQVEKYAGAGAIAAYLEGARAAI